MDKEVHMTLQPIRSKQSGIMKPFNQPIHSFVEGARDD